MWLFIVSLCFWLSEFHSIHSVETGLVVSFLLDETDSGFLRGIYVSKQ